eukprot:TRINITY_DN67686_c0_g1_i1.p1 TRINITY_DN67686_c0_g1~~TRINITY_DN67686_c0_g1_i1.p1  ORF type:complete len:683 (+),score=95.65 TRINITY_DN67686_c0_g1_i1:81-2129(+)
MVSYQDEDDGQGNTNTRNEASDETTGEARSVTRSETRREIRRQDTTGPSRLERASDWASGWVKSFSATRVIRNTSAAWMRLAGGVSRKSVVLFLCWDVLVTGIIVTFYWIFDDLANLGFMDSGYLCCVGVFRMVSHVAGAVVSWQRNHRLVRIFFGVFILNTFAYLLFTVPLMGNRLVCHCTKGTWQQCLALQSFAFDGLKLNYKPIPSNIDKFDAEAVDFFEETGSRMLIAKPPSSEKPWQWEQPSSLQQKSRGSNDGISRYRLPKRILGHLNLEPDFVASPKEVTVSMQRSLREELPTSLLERSTADTTSRADILSPVSTSGDALGFECNNFVLEPEKGSSLMQEAQRVSESLSFQNMSAQNYDQLVEKIWNRSGNDFLWKVKKILTDTVVTYVQEVCRGRPPLQALNQQEKEHTRSTPDLVNMTPRQGMEKLKKIYLDTCRCANTSSCLFHLDHDGARDSWCYVDESSLKACKKEGFDLFDDGGKPWSRDLCTARGCKCQGLGMPQDPKKITDEKDSPPHAMEFGNECDKHAGDERYQWCYVGWDTTCTERKRLVKNPDSKYQDVPFMFQSFMACHHLKGRLKLPKLLCRYVQIYGQIFLWCHFVIVLPRLVIMRHFVSNRCGDAHEDENQFAVASSDSEDEDSDSAHQDPASSSGKQDRRDSFTPGKRDDDTDSDEDK